MKLYVRMCARERICVVCFFSDECMFMFCVLSLKIDVTALHLAASAPKVYVSLFLLSLLVLFFWLGYYALMSPIKIMQMMCIDHVSFYSHCVNVNVGAFAAF